MIINNSKQTFLAGFYIHIPFCKQACFYCNFYFSTSAKSTKEMTAALVKEIELRRNMADSDEQKHLSIISPTEEKIETIYFGGGTPSLLSFEEIPQIISTIKKNYQVSSNAEVTLEANPDDINAQTINDWKSAGINRLSIGIQSFIERDLKWMNRAHNAEQALRSIELARQAGFNNFSIDLIFGTPGLSDEEWEKNIQTAIDLQVPHISSYALTVEPKTALHKMIALKKKENINDDVQARQFMLLMEILKDAGYEHYEISNFAKHGFRSRHNSSYWQGEKYIGIGPSAHSFDGEARSWNVANNHAYTKSILENKIPSQLEVLTPSQKLNEYVMTSLRTIEGMDLDLIATKFSNSERSRIEHLMDKKVESEYFIRQGNKIILTGKGKLFADRIAVELFL
ncbi:MAG TPA: radical SAM family heme chaperone HemW [Hanamia sp.]|nr:radical SAM family heme chaperone HemW [Hanamia sp.]